MRCPTCGYQIEQPTLARCPNCGNALPTQAADTTANNPPPPWRGYGQPGQYSQPIQPGGYPPAAPFAPAGYPPAQPPQQSPQQSPTGLAMGIVAGVVVLLLVCTGGLAIALAAFTSNRSPNGTGGGPMSAAATATTTATPAVATVPGPLPSPTGDYRVSFASAAAGWLNVVGHCYWKAGAYHVAAGSVCYAPLANQAVYDLTVDVRQLRGDANVPYGLVFAGDGIDNYYEFGITSDGRWVLFKCDRYSCSVALMYAPSSGVIHSGLNTTNKLEVVVRGIFFEFLVNGRSLGNFSDARYTSGGVGIFTGQMGESAFSNFSVTHPG